MSAAADVALLDAAWSGEETFAFLPARSGSEPSWLAQALAELPEDLRRGHFGLLTSGTTGEPKLVLGEKKRAESLAAVLDRVQDSGAVEATLLALPLSYTYAFVNQWLWARVAGKRCQPTGGFGHPEVLRTQLEAEPPSMFCLVAAQVPLLVHAFGERARFPSVVRLHFAGSPFPWSRLEQLRSLFPEARIFNNYGCAEAMPRLCVWEIHGSENPSEPPPPLPGITLRAESDGLLCFRSPYGAVAYLDARGLHRLTNEDWVPTGDLAESLPDGHFRLLGRASEVFKRHGEKVSLSSLREWAQRQWDGQVALYREQDASGEAGYVLVLSPAPSEEHVRTLLSGLRKDHARAQWPLRIESIRTFPQLPSGKVDLLGLSTADGRVVHWRQRI